MKRVAALVLVLLLVTLARRLGGDASERFATMALGFVLIVASLVGEAGEHVRLPRLTGYLAVGVCFGPSVLGLITPTMTAHLRLVNGLAVALIAFGAGMELDLPALRGRFGSLAKHGGALLAVLFVGLVLAFLAASPWLPFTAGEPWPRRLAMALVVGAVMATFSPTVVMAILSETGAKGPLSERVLQLVVAGDLGLVLLFTAATSAARVLDGSHVDLAAAFGHAGWELAGSLLVGALCGVLIVLYRRLMDARTGLFIAGVCVLVAEVGGRAGLSPLLTCLVAGLVFRNLAPHHADSTETLLERVRTPVLVVFFAATGASLHLDGLATLGVVAAGLAVVRGMLILGGNALGARAGRLAPAIARFVPLGLVSQAGVSIGLAVLVGRDFGAWGHTLETLFVTTIALHELVGPICFRWALARLGELRRGGGAVVGAGA